MTLVRYEPWGLVNRFHRELNDLLADNVAVSRNAEARSAALIPDVDVREETDRYVVRADLPGVAPSDIEVTSEQGVLTIRAERKSEKRETKPNFERVERVHGTFVRRFTLPEDAAVDNISARSVHGVLELTIAKAPKAQPRKIAVETA
jgi:HSP20 family protein